MWTPLDSAGRAGFYSCQIVRGGLVIFIVVSTGDRLCRSASRAAQVAREARRDRLERKSL